LTIDNCKHTLSCRAKRRDVNQSIQLMLINALNKAAEARVAVVHTLHSTLTTSQLPTIHTVQPVMSAYWR